MNYKKWDRIGEDEDSDSEVSDRVSRRSAEQGNKEHLRIRQKRKPPLNSLDLTRRKVQWEWMNSLGLSSTDLLKQAVSMGVNVDGLLSGGAFRTNEQTREKHLKALDYYNSKEALDGKVTTSIVTPGMDPISAKFVSSHSLNSLTTLNSVKQLRVGVINSKKLLWCTVVEPVFRISGMQVLVADPSDNVFTLAIYNLVDNTATTFDCQRKIPVGTRIGVKEPYLKCMNDGCLGLRVDNVCNIEIILPQKKSKKANGVPIVSASEYKELANADFKESKFDSARDLYSAGISALAQSGSYV